MEPYNRHFTTEIDHIETAALNRVPDENFGTLTSDPNFRFCASQPNIFELSHPETVIKKDYDVHIEKTLKTRWIDIHGGLNSYTSTKQRAFLKLITSYTDVFYACVPYPTFPYSLDVYTDACLLHSINHCKKSKIVRKERFTRAKVLIVTPMNNRIWSILARIIQLTSKLTAMKNKKKEIYQNYFGSKIRKGKEKNTETKKKLTVLDGKKEKRKYIGIKIDKTSASISDLHNSDIVILSPEAVSTLKVKRSLDFLSSIEILIIDRADLINMQNWRHINILLNELNRMPNYTTNWDISRISYPCISGKASFYRQSILLSSFLSAEMHETLTRYCLNHRGRWEMIQKMNKIPLRNICQQFVRIPVKNTPSRLYDRLDFFIKKIWPRIEITRPHGLLIFVSSYLEFICIRNFFKKNDVSFTYISEYLSHSAIKHNKFLFTFGLKNLLIYTERAHFYNRLTIRGIKDILFYDLPSHSNFYTEIINMAYKEVHGLKNRKITTLLFGMYFVLNHW
eukprot:gnl/TRDRNA2_/TRDRNA2_177234_c0_seq2.p1 gnl/TRDRNA2_/TRDRNA2_177234_c0~~gnl/TRDRNA2_/TRDRNA2_177234_c0_seq2.p1  ORF type:complete len:509 (+),score=-38.14 gnl/TRDRNA2_/TRDRNA2_177234_c0_seq2:81-1607(+)